MINKELIKSYVNQLSIEQLRRIVFEVINHYQINEEYYYEKVIDNIVNIAQNNSKFIDNVKHLCILKENPDIFAGGDTKVILDSIKIIGYDNIINSVKIEYKLENCPYPYRTNIDIDKIKEQQKLNNLK